VIATAVAETASRAPLAGHLWHLVAGIVPLVGAVIVVLIERLRGQEMDREDYLARPAARALLSADSFGIPRDRLASPDASAGPRSTRPRRPSVSKPGLAVLAALGLLVAAGVHVAVMPEHFRESWLYGAFFLGTAGAQVGAAVLVWRYPTRARLLAIALASLAVVLLWAWTRVVGVPLGPGAGEVESIGWLDVVASAAEVVTAIGCLAAAATPKRIAHPMRAVRASVPS
jgi:hypothetical protein